jgi:hypothetical protein
MTSPTAQHEIDGVPIKWRWVDDAGRAMTDWKTTQPPPILDLADAKGSMHVEVAIADAGDQRDREEER